MSYRGDSHEIEREKNWGIVEVGFARGWLPMPAITPLNRGRKQLSMERIERRSCLEKVRIILKISNPKISGVNHVAVDLSDSNTISKCF